MRAMRDVCEVFSIVAHFYMKINVLMYTFNFLFHKIWSEIVGKAPA